MNHRDNKERPPGQGIYSQWFPRDGNCDTFGLEMVASGTFFRIRWSPTNSANQNQKQKEEE